MSMDLTGITNQNEYYTNHYFSSIFEENASETLSSWRAEAKDNDEIKTPWALLRECAKQYYPLHDRFVRSRFDRQTLLNIQTLADDYLKALGYPEAKVENISVDESITAPVYLEMTKANGAPLLWVVLAASTESEIGILESNAIFIDKVAENESFVSANKEMLTEIANEELATKILFSMNESPRFLIFIGMNQIALIDRNKWNEKRYLQFELEDIFSRREETTLQAMSVLLHKDSLCPEEGNALLDELDANSQKHAAGVSQDLKYALRESIELLGNEVLYDMEHRQGIDLIENPIDAGELTIECLRYMYRMLFVLFIEARPELGYAPIKAQSYLTGYSLESLRDIADNIREDIDEVGEGYYLHETLAKLYELIYTGYPEKEEDILKYSAEESLHDMFIISPLKAHIFDPEYTKYITNAKLRNSVMLRIIDLMSLTRASERRNERRGRISYANLGINQLGAVYEALLSYRGFIAEEDLYEVKRAGDNFNELDVGYFIKERELDQYTEEERVRYEKGENKGKLRMYKKGSFIYRLAGREREKSASYYTPEVLTKCLVKYALKELLEGKSADDILNLTVCEPAMGSAAFLNETINQLAEAYIDKKQKELGETISYENRFTEIQKVKMYLADRNVYGVDLNPIAVELAEVSLWLNTIYEGGFVPWFGTQLVNGNSLIGARRQCYRIEQAKTTVKGMRWFENAPERLPFGTERADKGYQFGRKQIYHFLLGDPGMCNYSDKVIKSLEPDNIKKMVNWNKAFTSPISDDDVITLLHLSEMIDKLWEDQISLRKDVEEHTKDALSIYGHEDDAVDSHTTIRQKDRIYSEIYKSEHMRNAGPYARLKFAMDYWCALWFWPINQADLLPSRSEFLFDMALILEGTTSLVNVDSNHKGQIRGQLSFFPTEMQQMEQDLLEKYGNGTVVDIPRLRKENPRLDLVAKIAEQNKFMHWELEFADLFADRGGFDLVIGNPPWIKIEWNEQGVLSDKNPIFAVKNMSATQITQYRNIALQNQATNILYFNEYEMISGEQSFLGAFVNYPDLRGAVNLFKCFLPQAWQYGNHEGISAFVHPNGVFEDPKGNVLRQVLYPHLLKHFRFENELKLFAEVGNAMKYSLNIYSNKATLGFDAIFNLFLPNTIDECYEGTDLNPVQGVKDENDKWNVVGHSDRIIHIQKPEMKLFASLLDNSDAWQSCRLPVIHCIQFLDVLRCFEIQQHKVADYEDSVATSSMWTETGAQEDGTIIRNVHFPDTLKDLIYSGPHIGVGNPLFQTSQRNCATHRAFDSVDLTRISSNYLQRCNYSIACTEDEYFKKISSTPWGTKFSDEYRIAMREMINLSGERSLVSCIIPPFTANIHTIFDVTFENKDRLVLQAGAYSSLPYDFLVKAIGKGHVNYSENMAFAIIDDVYNLEIMLRTLLLNCVTSFYASLWKECWKNQYSTFTWTKEDNRLTNTVFSELSEQWKWEVPLRTDYERRQALIEIDVLVAMSLGMTLNQLKTIYRNQFPVLKQYEADTWFDANGRIAFTNNRSLSGIGVDRTQFENNMKNSAPGKIFKFEKKDDTGINGPQNCLIEYKAPFNRCDREKDYEIAWKFFEDKYEK